MSTIQAAIDHAGGQTALARKLGLTQATVGDWLSERRPIPDEKCPAIELATAGVVSCEALRPDLRWRRVRDKDWPWNGGRPLLDLTPVAA